MDSIPPTYPKNKTLPNVKHKAEIEVKKVEYLDLLNKRMSLCKNYTSLLYNYKKKNKQNYTFRGSQYWI